jgi:hypothetical protein
MSTLVPILMLGLTLGIVVIVGVLAEQEQACLDRTRRPERQKASSARAKHLWSMRCEACAKRTAVVAAAMLLWCNCAFAADAQVLLLRGWFGVFSTGLDRLADELRTKGIDADVTGHLNWSARASELLRERAAGKTGPIVLVGHSQGANNVIDIARTLEPHNIPVDLLITLAPFMQDPIPANVVRAINYYQPHGWGSPITPDRGFHGQLSNIDVGNDWSISHISIDKSTRIHADISDEIAGLYRSEAKGASRKLPVPAVRSLVGLNR